MSTGRLFARAGSLSLSLSLSLFLLCTAGMLAACGGAAGENAQGASAPEGTSSSAPPISSPIASVWRSRCGACHLRVEPGTRTRQHLEDALARHRKRVRLKEDQWQELVTFLATKP